MRIAILTSSRADYGIYLPLIRKLQDTPGTTVGLIVFGTHNSWFHGHTIDQIRKDGFPIDAEVYSMLTGDTPEAIATAMGLTQVKFSQLWEQNKDRYDIVICLGDRFEMFAAVSAGVAFGICFAHLHGGETTLGAIDDVLRHSITLFSTLHFTSTEAYRKKVLEITGGTPFAYNVGALSLQNIGQTPLLSPGEFQERFGVDMTKTTLLVTFHPETKSPEFNVANAKILCQAIVDLDLQTIITMPNADTSGNEMREVYLQFARSNPQFHLVENMGTQGYFSALQLSHLVIGNSSSGIIEAASFGKYVIDIGNRQEGRATSDNVFHIPAEKDSIISLSKELLKKAPYGGLNIYFHPDTANLIVGHLKNYLNGKS